MENRLSSNETIFNSYKPEYEQVLKESGFEINLKLKRKSKGKKHMQETEHVKSSGSILHIQKM